MEDNEWIIRYNSNITKIQNETFYCRTDSVELDDNYIARLKLLALVEKNEAAINEYKKIQEIISLKDEKYKLLEKDENGNLRIEKYDLSPESYTYIISSFMDFYNFKNLFKIENINGKNDFLIKKLGIKDSEIARLLSDIKNENIRNFLMVEKVEDDGKMIPVIMKLFDNSADIKRVCCAANYYSEDIVKNIINGEYGDFGEEIEDIILVNISEDTWNSLMQDEKIFDGKEKLFENLKTKMLMLKEIKNDNGEIKGDKYIKIPMDMTVGVEIEMVGPVSKFLYGKLINGFVGESDITIKDINYEGVEVKSPKLTNLNINDVLNMQEKFINLGQFTNITCGGHIHIGATYFNVLKENGELDLVATKLAWKSFFEIWKNTEEIMYKLFTKEGERHRGISFAKPFSEKIEKILQSGILNTSNKKDLNVTFETMKNIQVEEEPILAERNFAINLSNLDRDSKKTIEFRLANGPKDKIELLKNIVLVTNLMVKSKEIGIAESKKLRGKELNEEEKKLLLLKEHLVEDKELSENEKFDDLMNLLFENEKKRTWYRIRYKDSKVDLEKLKKEMNSESRFENTFYGSPLSPRDRKRLQEYDKLQRRAKIDNENVEFSDESYTELVINQKPDLLKKVFNGIKQMINYHRGEYKREKIDDEKSFDS